MNEVLTHDMKLLGLKMPYEDEMCSYFEELPDHFTKCINFRDLYRLKKHKRNDLKENIEIFLGLDILIHVKSENRYYYRTLKEYSNMNNLLKFFKDGNLYILKDELRQKEEPEPVEEPVKDIIEDKDVLIF
jgi:hypothetical protein